jgi:DNA-binding NarL/FixJ family response regulator
VPEPREAASSVDVIAVLNATPDALAILRMALQHEGFTVVGALIPEIRAGAIDLDAFIRQHDPRVIVYDVALPDEAEWRMLQRYKAMPSLARCRWILTSTNKGHVERLAADDAQIFAVVGTPYELQKIVQAVRDALRASPPG